MIFTCQPCSSGAFTARALRLALSSSFAEEPGQLPEVLHPDMPTAGPPRLARGGTSNGETTTFGRILER